MPEPPLLLVLLPLYERPQHFTPCLDALLSQEGVDFRVLCFADPSEEEPRAAVEAQRDARVTLCPAGRGAWFAAANEALRSADASYCLFLHPADLLLPGFLSAACSLAGRYEAELVLCETGAREPGSGALREKGFFSLRRSLLPASPVFTPASLRGDFFRLVRFPSWLTLFRVSFLRQQGLGCPETGSSNDLYLGRCALAAAKRVCVLEEKLAYLHRNHRARLPHLEEMAALYAFLQDRDLYPALARPFVHALVKETAFSLRNIRTDAERYALLDELNAPWFQNCGALGREDAWYDNAESVRDAAFLTCVSRRYQTVRAGRPEPPPPELVCGAADGPEPLVSVVMPVYNTEAYVEQALRSVLSQTLRELEVICLDDGSTDGSLAVLRRLAREDGRIRLYRQENCGLSASRNRGAALARGRYLYFMDSDDLLLPTALAETSALAERDGLELVLFNGQDFYDEAYLSDKERLSGGPFIGRDYPGVHSGPELFAQMFPNTDHCSVVWLQLLRRSAMLETGLRFHEGILYEDVPYSVALLLRTQRAAYLHRILYLRRVRNESITTVERRLEHSYGLFRGYLDMRSDLEAFGEKLSAEERDCLRSRMRLTITEARTLYLDMPERCRGEEFGLGDDFFLFRMLVGSCCEQTGKCVELRESLRSTKRQLQQARAARQKAEQQLKKLEASLRETEELFLEKEQEAEELADSLASAHAALEKQRRENQTLKAQLAALRQEPDTP